MRKAVLAFCTPRQLFLCLLVDDLYPDTFAAEDMHARQPDWVVENVSADWTSEFGTDSLIFVFTHANDLTFA